MELIAELDLVISLWSQDGIAKSIENSTPDTLFKFIETLYLSTRNHSPYQDKNNENFSFIANTSLSGGATNCASLDCRLNKLDELVSFASLYADVIYINNPFEPLYFSWDDLHINHIKNELLIAIYQYFYLKPYLSLGIIQYSSGYMSLCSHHHETLAKPLAEKILKKEQELTSILNEHLLSNCTISLDKFDNGEIFIEILDKGNIIDHGSTHLHFYQKPKSKHLRKLAEKNIKHTFSREEIEQENILQSVVYPLVNDIVEQEWISHFYNSSLLIDNKEKIKITGKLNAETMSINANTFNQSVSHYLPTIHCRDPLEILKLREREDESFKVYRDKLKKLLLEAPKQKQEYFPEIFRDTILPEINLMNKKLKDYKIKKRNNLRDKLIFGSGAVAFGLYSGVLPSNIGSILAAIGGGSAIVSSMIDYKSAFLSEDEIRSSDYYFLWQLTK
ncbi:hypothetical protein [Enterobacter sichuanensis]|uniref:hypothetical protein n=1 Tax=Enterobacter sichuanensis TaxID=2071710 RepID=UPI003754F7A0